MPRHGVDAALYERGRLTTTLSPALFFCVTDVRPQRPRDAQKAFITARDAPAKGNAWERVYNLVDLNPKAQKSSKDLSRARSVLTQLKASPNAPGAAA